MGTLDDTDAQASRAWPELEALANPARERRRLPPEVRSRIILELCAVAPLSVKDLSTLLQRSEAYVGDAIRPLVAAGDLTFLYPDQPRHPKQKYRAASQPLAASASRFEPAGAPAEPVAKPPATPARRQPGIASPAEPRLEPPAEPRLEATRPVPVSPSMSPPEAARTSPEERGTGSFPNHFTNGVVVLLTGILLAVLDVPAWLIYALLTALALAAAHVLAHSQQYERFRELLGKTRGRLAFVILKSAVAAAEIAIIYFVTNAVAG